jgi:hypothetical protein
MSRLIDKLKNLREAAPQPLGFTSTAASTAKPRMQLIALVAADNLSKVSDKLSPADAVLVEVAKSDDVDELEKVCKAKDGLIGGAWLKASNGGSLKKVLNAACDFVVFAPSAPLTVTQKDKLGRVLEMDAALSEGLLRTAADLPVDVVLAAGTGDEKSLTLNRLMLIQRVVYLVGKPILVPVPIGINGAELQALWDMGIGGVVAEVTDEKSADKLSDLNKLIEKLNPPAFRKKSKAMPILPAFQPAAPEPPEKEGGEEEDE